MNDTEREARRWFLQAADDLKFVNWIRKEGVFFDKACFLSQQAGEKALKACLYSLGKRRVIGHSLFEMVHELQQNDARFAAIMDEARRLDRYYIAARYPNGLPGGSPFQAYTKDDLEQAANDVGNVLALVTRFLEGRLDLRS